MFWSSDEDGFVRQIDARVPHTCADDPSSPCTDTVLLNLRSRCRNCQNIYGHRSARRGGLGVKSIDISQASPNHLLIGACSVFCVRCVVCIYSVNAGQQPATSAYCVGCLCPLSLARYAQHWGSSLVTYLPVASGRFCVLTPC